MAYKVPLKVIVVVGTLTTAAYPLSLNPVKARSVTIQQRRLNAGSGAQSTIYVGESGVLSANKDGYELRAPIATELLPELTLEAQDGEFLDLSQIFISPAQATDAVTVLYQSL